MPPILEMSAIAKEYYGNRVLKGVDLSVDAGEIVCLVGENGAGKSTLMNILFGMPVVHATGGFSGAVKIAGQRVAIDSPFKAMECGIGMVHQEFMLLPGFTVTENIKLNRELTSSNPLSSVVGALSPSAGKRLESLDFDSMTRDARAALARVGLEVESEATVGGLPVGHKQFIEIAREVDRHKARILVFDEPSAVLTESEADRLLETMRALARDGIGILFITHRLDEVMAVADRIVVLRDGERVAQLAGSEASVGRIAELMVGRKIEKRDLPPRSFSVSDAELALDIRDLVVDMPGEPVTGATLSVRRGEILGIGGLAGYGKLGIANGIAGIYPGRGTVLKDGLPLPLNDPAGSLARRVAFLSEDRRGVGLLLDESIELNIGLTSLQVQGKFLRTWLPGLSLLDAAGLRAHAREMIRWLDVRCVGPEQPVRRLSGGNQQKVCIAKAVTLDPDLLFVSEPTRGVDVGAKQRILDELVSLNRDRRMTIVVTSSELAELRSVCDRIAIVARGKVSRVLAPDAADVDFGLAMAG
ncbi:MAG: sugar ABC transporter ATP-binding protein [Candidatus Wallbacteria bacterium]|nr:sugar ABC transporter ATP-binding protein [Candidatus Wallbacteria bacterium]